VKNGKAWGLKRHVWPAAQNTTTSYVSITGLEDLSVEDMDKWVIFVEVTTPGSVTNVDVQANEFPDAPALFWASLLGYPQQISTATGWHRGNVTCEYHKRIRVRIQAASAGCTATVHSVWAGWAPWVEGKE